MDRWYDYQCLNKACNGAVVLDIRINGAITPPDIDCPLCHKRMQYGGTWEADEDGYGSRGDYSVRGEKPPGSLIP